MKRRAFLRTLSAGATGAVVGGAYASGRSVDELEALVKSANWNAILADRPARDRLSIRRREDDERLPSRIEFGFNLARGAMLPALIEPKANRRMGFVLFGAIALLVLAAAGVLLFHDSITQLLPPEWRSLLS